MSERCEKLGLDSEDFKVLLDLERIINTPLDKVYKISMDSCGIEIKGDDKWITLIQNAS